VTSLSVRPVTFLSVIYNQESHNNEFWKIGTAATCSATALIKVYFYRVQVGVG
jgi:hypothetical protein